MGLFNRKKEQEINIRDHHIVMALIKRTQENSIHWKYNMKSQPYGLQVSIGEYIYLPEKERLDGDFNSACPARLLIYFGASNKYIICQSPACETLWVLADKQINEARVREDNLIKDATLRELQNI